MVIPLFDRLSPGFLYFNRPRFRAIKPPPPLVSPTDSFALSFPSFSSSPSFTSSDLGRVWGNKFSRILYDQSRINRINFKTRSPRVFEVSLFERREREREEDKIRCKRGKSGWRRRYLGRNCGPTRAGFIYRASRFRPILNPVSQRKREGVAGREVGFVTYLPYDHRSLISVKEGEAADAGGKSRVVRRYLRRSPPSFLPPAPS